MLNLTLALVLVGGWVLLTHQTWSSRTPPAAWTIVNLPHKLCAWKNTELQRARENMVAPRLLKKAVPEPCPRCPYRMGTGSRKKNPAVLTSHEQAAQERDRVGLVWSF